MAGGMELGVQTGAFMCSDLHQAPLHSTQDMV